MLETMFVLHKKKNMGGMNQYVGVEGVGGRKRVSDTFEHYNANKIVLVFFFRHIK